LGEAQYSGENLREQYSTRFS